MAAPELRTAPRGLWWLVIFGAAFLFIVGIKMVAPTRLAHPSIQPNSGHVEVALSCADGYNRLPLIAEIFAVMPALGDCYSQWQVRPGGAGGFS